MLKNVTFLSKNRIIFLYIVLEATPAKIGERFVLKNICRRSINFT